MIKAGLIESDTLIARRILHEVKRHAEGVVEFESFLHRRKFFLDCLQANSSSFSKPTSSVCAKRVSSTRIALRNTIGSFVQFWIRILHQVAHRKHHLVQKRSCLSEQTSMRDCAPNDLPQYIPAALIRGQHSVGNQERRRARVICNHSQRSRRFRLSFFLQFLA